MKNNENTETDSEAKADSSPSPCYAFRAIDNGIIMTYPDGSERHHVNIDQCGEWLAMQIVAAHNSAKESEWDGSFAIKFSHDIPA